jgi:GNAT superfamily N-acetyltransferase
VSTSEFVIETDPTPEQVQYLEDGLYEFNSEATGITDGQGLAIFVKDEPDRIVGGICGHTWGGCCEIRQLWVEESRRRQGIGTRLLRAAEQEARRRNFRQMVLTTFSFQAPEFYTEALYQHSCHQPQSRGRSNRYLLTRLSNLPTLAPKTCRRT